MALVSVEAMLGKVGDAMMPRIRKPRPPKRYPRRPWTAEDDAYLAKWHNVKEPRLVARALKRSVHSIFQRAYVIGVSYVGHRLALTPAHVATMLGINAASMQRRLTSKAVDPIPHHRIGRYIEIYETELMEWLNRGNVLAFDRAKIDPDLHRMYDVWRGRVITSAEITEECAPLMEQWSKTRAYAPDIVCMMPGHINAYLKDDVFAWAYQCGHLIPPWASPRFKVIRQAWDTEWIMKTDVVTTIGYNVYARKVKPHIERETFSKVHRSELCARLAALGMHDLVKRWKSVPIPWQELMSDYERSMK